MKQFVSNLIPEGKGHNIAKFYKNGEISDLGYIFPKPIMMKIDRVQTRDLTFQCDFL